MLHDALLLHVSLDWSKGTAIFQFRAVSGSTIAVLSGCTEMNLPRREPWGPSESVNSVEVGQPESGGILLRIEMQSGDLLVTNGESIEWHHA